MTTPTPHRLVIEPDAHDGFTGHIEHVGPVDDRCHAYDVCEVCIAELTHDEVDYDAARTQLIDLIDRDEVLHDVKHAWFDGEPYRLADVARCYLLDWPDDTFVEEARRLVEEHKLTPGRYPIATITLTEDECEIDLEPTSLPSVTATAADPLAAPVVQCAGQIAADLEVDG